MKLGSIVLTGMEKLLAHVADNTPSQKGYAQGKQHITLWLNGVFLTAALWM